MDSFSSPSSGSSSQFNSDAFKDQLKNQLAQAYAEEFLEVQVINPWFFFFFCRLIVLFGTDLFIYWLWSWNKIRGL